MADKTIREFEGPKTGSPRRRAVSYDPGKRVSSLFPEILHGSIIAARLAARPR
jgi:hypothetical protein